MYRKPGFYEVSFGVSGPEWAARLYTVRGPGTTWDANLKELWKSISPNFKRKLRFLQLDEVAIASSPLSPNGSDSQKAFAHLVIRWLKHLGIPSFSEYPVVPAYARTPRITLDECIDEMISRAIVMPDWTDIGNKEATIEEVMPAFSSFIRQLHSIARMRVNYVELLRTKVSDLAYRIALGGTLDQFEKSFFLSFCDPSSLYGSSAYLPRTNPLPIAENSNPLVETAFSIVRTCVEAGPFLRFGVLQSNQLLQELFAFYGPHTPSLDFHYGYGSTVGPFLRLSMPDSEKLDWSMEEQEDAVRNMASIVQLTGTNIINAQPYVDIWPVKRSLGQQAGNAFEPMLDLPDVELRMSRGFDGFAHTYEAEWYSPVRGRRVSTAHGADALLLLQDLALKHAKLGEGLTSLLSLNSWKLFDTDSLFGQNGFAQGDKLSKQADFKEEIIYRAASGALQTTTLDLATFYTTRGTIMMRPAFTEFVEIHRNSLFIEDPAAESWIANKLNLSRGARRASVEMIRASHRWSVLRRLFNVEVMSFADLTKTLALRYGSVDSVDKPATALTRENIFESNKV